MYKSIYLQLSKPVSNWALEVKFFQRTYLIQKNEYGVGQIQYYIQLLTILYCCNANPQLLEAVCDLMKAKVPYENIYEYIRNKIASA